MGFKLANIIEDICHEIEMNCRVTIENLKNTGNLRLFDNRFGANLRSQRPLRAWTKRFVFVRRKGAAL